MDIEYDLKNFKYPNELPVRVVEDREQIYVRKDVVEAQQTNKIKEIYDFVESESGKSGRKEILDYLDQLLNNKEK